MPVSTDAWFQSSQYKLHLHIKRAQNTCRPRHSYQQFFVKIRVAQYRTETSQLDEYQTNFNIPSWDEEFDFHLHSLDYPLDLKIVERDKFGDHFIGRCSTDLYDFELALPVAVVKPLEDKRGVASKLNGQIEFQLQIEDTTTKYFGSNNLRAEDSEFSLRLPANGKINLSNEDSNHSITESTNSNDISTNSHESKHIVNGIAERKESYSDLGGKNYLGVEQKSLGSRSITPNTEANSSRKGSSSKLAMGDISEELFPKDEVYVRRPLTISISKPDDDIGSEDSRYLDISSSPSLFSSQTNTDKASSSEDGKLLHKHQVDQQVDQQVNQQVKQQVNQQVEKQVDQQVDQQMDQQVDQQVNQQVEKQGGYESGGPPVGAQETPDIGLYIRESSVCGRKSTEGKERDKEDGGEKTETMTETTGIRETASFPVTRCSPIPESATMETTKLYDNPDNTVDEGSDKVKTNIYRLLIVLQSIEEAPNNSILKFKVNNNIKKIDITKMADGPVSPLEFYLNKSKADVLIQVCNKNNFKECHGETKFVVIQSPLHKHVHTLRLRGPNGGKLKTVVNLRAELSESDKTAATKLMRKRALSFRNKDFKLRVLSRAKSQPLFRRGGTPCSADKEPDYKYVIRVTLLEAKNMCGKGSKQVYDTYAKLQLGTTNYRTKTIKKSGNPTFNETFEFHFNELSETLRIKIYHANKLFDEMLGNSNIRLSVLPFDTDLSIVDFPLLTEEARIKCHNPTLSFTIRLTCLAARSIPSPLPASHSQPPESPRSFYRVYVTVYRATNLPPYDETGLSDPFVLLRIGSLQYQTEVVLNTLSPIWNEQFVFTVTSLEQELCFTVLDEDSTTNEHIGELSVKLDRLPLDRRCEHDVPLRGDAGNLEFSIHIQDGCSSSGVGMRSVPHTSSTQIPTARLLFKPVGFAHSENSIKQSYRLEVMMGRTKYSVRCGDSQHGSWNFLDVYESGMQNVHFNLYMVTFGLQEKLVGSSMDEVTVSLQNITIDIPFLNNLFFISVYLEYLNYTPGSCNEAAEYEEDKVLENLSFEEVDEVLVCPYNYALCVDTVMVHTSGVFGDDLLYVLIEVENIKLKNKPNSISDGNEMFCGFIYRLKHYPSNVTISLYKYVSNYSIYLGQTTFLLPCTNPPPSEEEISLDVDGTLVRIGILFNVVFHPQQEIVTAMKQNLNIRRLQPDPVDEAAIINNFKIFTFTLLLLNIILRYVTDVRNLNPAMKLGILLVVYILLYYPLAGITVTHVIGTLIVASFLRLLYYRQKILQFQRSYINEMLDCYVDEVILIRSCDNIIKKFGSFFQQLLYVLSWTSTLYTSLFVGKTFLLLLVFSYITPVQLAQLLTTLFLAYNTLLSTYINTVIAFLNPLSGVPHSYYTLKDNPNR